MNLTRRDFLKVLGLGVAAVAMPTPINVLGNEILGEEKWTKPKKSNVKFNVGKQPAGDYTFSYYYKANNPRSSADKHHGDWYRHTELITLEEEMDMAVSIDMTPGEEMTMPQLEPTSSNTNNAIPNSNSEQLERLFNVDKYVEDTIGIGRTNVWKAV